MPVKLGGGRERHKGGASPRPKRSYFGFFVLFALGSGTTAPLSAILSAASLARRCSRRRLVFTASASSRFCRSRAISAVRLSSASRRAWAIFPRLVSAVSRVDEFSSDMLPCFPQSGAPMSQAREGTIDRELHGGALRCDRDEVRRLRAADLLALRAEAFAMRDLDLAIDELERHHGAALHAPYGGHGPPPCYNGLIDERGFAPSNSVATPRQPTCVDQQAGVRAA